MLKRIFILQIFILLLLTILKASPLTWEEINSDGMGNSSNSGLYPGPVKEGYLYLTSNNSMDGAHLWRYNAQTWETITSDGFNNSHNNAFVQPTSYRDSIYYFTHDTSNGTLMLGSSDGASWNPVSSNGFGDYSNVSVYGRCIGDTALYIGTWNTSCGSQVWTYNGSNFYKIASASTTWADCSNIASFPELYHNDYLYVGTDNSETGAQLWRYDGNLWENITMDGFGDHHNRQIKPVYASFSGYIYVYTYNSASGAQIWRSSTGDYGSWTEVISNGFSDIHNYNIYSVSIPGDRYMYASTSNSMTGAEIWRTADGLHWEQVNLDGFGNSSNSGAYISRELYTASSPAVVASGFYSYLYVGTWNTSTGGQLYRLTTTAYTDPAEISIERGELTVMGSTAGKGTINPDKGDSLDVSFRGDSSGKYILRIFTLLGELVHDETKNLNTNAGTFSWIPEDIASGIYIVQVQGPGVNIKKKMAILR